MDVNHDNNLYGSIFKEIEKALEKAIQESAESIQITKNDFAFIQRVHMVFVAFENAIFCLSNRIYVKIILKSLQRLVII